MRARRDRESGITYLEVLVAMAVSMSMLAAGTSLYLGGLDASIQNQAQTSSHAMARVAVAQIDNDLKQGARILESRSVGGTLYVSGPDVVIVEIPAWDEINVQTTEGVDIAIYQYVDQPNNTYNMYHLFQPGSTFRKPRKPWLFPYEQSLNSTDPSKKRSDPWVEPLVNAQTGALEPIFKYYVQDGETGNLRLKTSSDPWNGVVVVETGMRVRKSYKDQPPIDTEIITRSRLRNWIPLNP